ncbi:DgyrCDS11859 [Dimorphilus gyrociliatus]|uniref:DgyrCDS11859 n=1 Tax=Dimorphilus gyrociliatus TaxID=2664684 RepID=A0A7I8W787_9ANNE|nr:DgyrCDS11859 [Dimorphilus gyrociliatus]
MSEAPKVTEEQAWQTCVEDLRRQVPMNRMPMSEALKLMLDFVAEKKGEDFLLTQVGRNSWTEAKNNKSGGCNLS